eukprot:XP_016659756.1 PREDICTED: uncharacterized protein LOC107883710 [Acyrthosiphon pisum]
MSDKNLNFQSLRAHSSDILDSVLQNSKILIFSETWQHENENTIIPNFNCIIKYKRPNVRSGGVAIYHNNDAIVNIVTPSTEMTIGQSKLYNSKITPVGEFCVAECSRQNEPIIIIVALYISPNQKIDDIVYFFKRSLIAYSTKGTPLLGRGEDKLPMILSGDFNINFASDRSESLTQFLREHLNLSMNNDPKIPTTRSGTTIDAIFTRYLNNVQSKTCITYFQLT